MDYSKKGISDKQKEITSKSKKLSTKLGLLILKVTVICLLLGIVVLGCVGFGMIKGLIDTAPDVSNIDLSPTGYATKVYDVDGNETASLVMSNSNRVYASIDEMPTHLIYAFVDIEDERFFEHNGIDIQGIFRAAYHGITTGKFDQGASTITQQLIKNKIFNTGMDENSFMDSLKRKIQEQYLAVKLSEIYTKEEILESYLNMINLGRNTLGVQSASKRYFNKDVWDLTISESAVIAAITKNPSGYDPISYPQNNNERRILVLKKMLEFGHITQSQYEAAVKEDVYSTIQSVNVEYESESSIYTYYTDALIDNLLEDLQEKLGYTETQAYYMIYSGGLSVFSCQDPKIQGIVDEAYTDESNFPDGTEYSMSWAWSVQHQDGTTTNYSERSLESYFKNGDEENGISATRFFKLIFDSKEEIDEYIETFKKTHFADTDIELGETLYYTPQPQSSFVIIDQSTGEVKALVGGRGQKQTSRSLNRATKTTRQPGSTFKIVSTYAAALDTAGFTLASVQYDEENYRSPDGTPFANYNHSYGGFTTLRDAIRRSVNIVAVKTMVDITPSLGFSYLRNFGFTTLVEQQSGSNGTSYTDIGYALSLGGITKGVTNLEMTASYAAIANGGVYIEPILYTKVLDHNGNVLLDNEPETRRVIKDTTAWLLTSAMEDVVTSGTGTAAKISGMATAGKTGSTSDYNDVWFVGYTPYYTAGIWSGYDENKSQSGSRASYHRAFWSKIMTKVHEGLENKNFTKPDGIETATICTKSGKRAIAGVCDSDPRGSMVKTEYFAKGTVPTDYCDNHVTVAICAESGQLASDFCPETSIVHRVYISKSNMKGTIVDNGDGTTTKTVGNSADIAYVLPDSLNVSCSIHTNASFIIPEPETNPDGTPVMPAPAETSEFEPSPDGTVAETTEAPAPVQPEETTTVEIISPEPTTSPEEAESIPIPEQFGPSSGNIGPWNEGQ